MQIISEKLKEHIQGEVTTLATCWRLELSDDTVMGFTDADFDLNIDSVIYYANSGFWASAVESGSTLKVDNLEVESMLDNDFISHQDVMSGRYDNAKVSIFIINYLEPTSGTLHLRTGSLGRISLSDNKFWAEIHGLTEAFSKCMGELYSPQCRANFGDARCKMDLSKYTKYGTITEVISLVKFVDSGRNEANGYYDYGLIEFLSGKNQGKKMEIKTSYQTEIELMLPLAQELNVGDEYKIIVGCNKNFTTCIQKFNNAINFRGEPHVPQIEKLLI